VVVLGAGRVVRVGVGGGVARLVVVTAQEIAQRVQQAQSQRTASQTAAAA
jgi:hypothetical protein